MSTGQPEILWGKKWVRLICDLRIGDIITVDPDFSNKLTGKKMKIIAIEFRRNSQTNVVVKTDKYDSFFDSDWIETVSRPYMEQT